MYGLTLEKYQEALNFVEALPLNVQESVVEPEAAKRKRSSKLATAQTGDQKFPSHIVKALNHLTGKAGFEVSSAVQSAFFTNMSIKRMEEKKDDQDRIDAANDKVEYNLERAKKWLSLRTYLADKLAARIEAEGLKQEMHDITPFEIKEGEVRAYLKEVGEEDQFESVMAEKEANRASVIEMIKGLTAYNDWGDDIGFISIARLVEKLDEFSDEQKALKHKWAKSSEKIAKSANIKMLAIEAVADKINDIVDNAYELVVDDTNSVH